MPQARIAAEIQALAARRDRLAIAVDGPDAAGKTMLADALANALPTFVVRASIDDFQRPRAERYQRGRLSPEGYYHDSFDHAALRRHLIEPFLAGAHTVRTAVFDHRSESVVTAATKAVPANAVLIVDGVFLLRPELRDSWTMSIYLHVPPEEALRRARRRDTTLCNSDEIEQRYQRRYVPGQAIYRAEAAPESAAHIVVDNSDPRHASILRWRPPTAE